MAVTVTLAVHLESYTPGQDQAKSYVPVCTSTYKYIPVQTSTGISDCIWNPADLTYTVIYRHMTTYTRYMTPYPMPCHMGSYTEYIEVYTFPEFLY